MKKLSFTKKAAIKALLVCLSLVWASSASASQLTDLKARGLIGERLDGYIGVVQTNAPTDVQAQVAQVNKKRRAAYQRIAEKNNLSIEEIAALAGKKTLQKTPPGQWVFNGTWQRK